MIRLNKIKRKEYCKFLIKAFAIKTMCLSGLVLVILKIILKTKYFLIKLLDSKLRFIIDVQSIKM
ncbi:hypothetical protein SAMN02983004_00868 [Borreliella japonica]|uniref:Uncharacterized protein n=1 Tax=Borreliella japonica TaxID=34095 RepID=A0A1G4Q257_BORJA|nr:hypothetical protein [Borreliella japonica]WKC88584.1 hypothetical protein QIA20_00335 [Borreliella japonica]SCW38408.1 hypothetical protein SAMN02983004_00868 [Borreliella japonica]